MSDWIYNTVYVIEVRDSDGDWIHADVSFDEDYAHEQGKEFVEVDVTEDYRVIPVAIKYLG